MQVANIADPSVTLSGDWGFETHGTGTALGDPIEVMQFLPNSRNCNKNTVICLFCSKFQTSILGSTILSQSWNGEKANEKGQEKSIGLHFVKCLEFFYAITFFSLHRCFSKRIDTTSKAQSNVKWDGKHLIPLIIFDPCDLTYPCSDQLIAGGRLQAHLCPSPTSATAVSTELK